MSRGLKEIKQALKQGYLNKGVIQSIVEEKADWPIEKSYINLALLKEVVVKKHEDKLDNPHSKHSKNVASETHREELLHNYEDLFAEKESITVEKIFQHCPPDQQRVLINGRAGIGKSTLCQYMAYLWGKGYLWADRFDWVFWIPLRHLQSRKFNNLLDLINECCFSHLLEPLSQDELLLLKEELLKNEKRILFQLDGRDELTKTEEQEPLLKPLLNATNLILTSRPYHHLGYSFGAKLEITGFTNDNVIAYVQNFYQQWDSLEQASTAQKAEQVVDWLQSNPSLWGIAHIPINLELICCLLAKRDFSSSNPKSSDLNDWSMTKLYHELVIWLLRRYLLKQISLSSQSANSSLLQPINPGKTEVNEVSTSTQVGDQTSSSSSTILLENPITVLQQSQDIITLLKTFAFAGMQSRQIILSGELLSQEMLKILPQVLQTGLLRKHKSGGYYFIHLTFQEFFSAWHIADSFQPSSQLSRMLTYEEIKPWIQKNKFIPFYEVQWWFVAGILKQSQNDFALNQFLEILYRSGTIDLFGMRILFLMVRCLDEAALKNSTLGDPLAEKILDHFKQHNKNLSFYHYREEDFKKFVNNLKVNRKFFHNYALSEKLINLLKNMKYVNTEVISGVCQCVIWERSTVTEQHAFLSVIATKCSEYTDHRSLIPLDRLDDEVLEKMLNLAIREYKSSRWRYALPTILKGLPLCRLSYDQFKSLYGFLLFELSEGSMGDCPTLSRLSEDQFTFVIDQIKKYVDSKESELLVGATKIFLEALSLVQLADEKKSMLIDCLLRAVSDRKTFCQNDILEALLKLSLNNEQQFKFLQAMLSPSSRSSKSIYVLSNLSLSKMPEQHQKYVLECLLEITKNRSSHLREAGLYILCRWMVMEFNFFSNSQFFNAWLKNVKQSRGQEAESTCSKTHEDLITVLAGLLATHNSDETESIFIEMLINKAIVLSTANIKSSFSRSLARSFNDSGEHLNALMRSAHTVACYDDAQFSALSGTYRTSRIHFQDYERLYDKILEICLERRYRVISEGVSDFESVAKSMQTIPFSMIAEDEKNRFRRALNLRISEWHDKEYDKVKYELQSAENLFVCILCCQKAEIIKSELTRIIEQSLSENVDDAWNFNRIIPAIFKEIRADQYDVLIELLNEWVIPHNKLSIEGLLYMQYFDFSKFSKEQKMRVLEIILRIIESRDRKLIKPAANLLGYFCYDDDLDLTLLLKIRDALLPYIEYGIFYDCSTVFYSFILFFSKIKEKSNQTILINVLFNKMIDFGKYDRRNARRLLSYLEWTLVEEQQKSEIIKRICTPPDNSWIGDLTLKTLGDLPSFLLFGLHHDDKEGWNYLTSIENFLLGHYAKLSNSDKKTLIETLCVNNTGLDYWCYMPTLNLLELYELFPHPLLCIQIIKKFFYAYIAAFYANFNSNQLCWLENGNLLTKKMLPPIFKQFLAHWQQAMNKAQISMVQLSKIRSLSALHLAISKDDLVQVKEELQQGADINDACNEEDITPLNLALAQRHWEIASYLLQQGADTRSFNAKGTNARFYLFSLSNPENADLEKLFLEKMRPFSVDYIEKLILENTSVSIANLESPAGNKATVEKLISQLTGVSHVLAAKDKERKIYLAHLQSFGNTHYQGNQRTYEGLFPQDALVLRLTHYLQLYLAIEENEHYRLPANFTRADVLVLLKREMVVLLEALRWKELTDIGAIPESLQRELLQHFLQCLQQLHPGEERIYQTGYKEHCIYVAFRREDNQLIVRVDNLEKPDIEKMKHPIEVKENRMKIKNTYAKPFFIGAWPISDIAHSKSLSEYLSNIIKAKDLDRNQALKSLYQPQPSADNFTVNWPFKRTQIVGNCAIRSYSFGLHIRLGKDFYRWLIKQESQLSLDKEEILSNQKHELSKKPAVYGDCYPAQDSTKELVPFTDNRETSLLINSNGTANAFQFFKIKNQAVVPFTKSHEELMQKLAKELGVDYSEVYHGTVVEQALVNLADIKTVQTGAKFRRNGDGSTRFELQFANTDEFQQFKTYYHQHYSNFLIKEHELVAGCYKFDVDTQSLYEKISTQLSTVYQAFNELKLD